MSLTSRIEKIKKSIKNKKLLDVINDLMKSNVTVSKMFLKVNQDGSVDIVECEYEEEVPESTPISTT